MSGNGGVRRLAAAGWSVHALARMHRLRRVAVAAIIRTRLVPPPLRPSS
jgi:hypothetical protein